VGRGLTAKCPRTWKSLSLSHKGVKTDRKTSSRHGPYDMVRGRFGKRRGGTGGDDMGSSGTDGYFCGEKDL